MAKTLLGVHKNKVFQVKILFKTIFRKISRSLFPPEMTKQLFAFLLTFFTLSFSKRRISCTKDIFSSNRVSVFKRGSFWNLTCDVIWDSKGDFCQKSARLLIKLAKKAKYYIWRKYKFTFRQSVYVWWDFIDFHGLFNKVLWPLNFKVVFFTSVDWNIEKIHWKTNSTFSKT